MVCPRAVDRVVAFLSKNTKAVTITEEIAQFSIIFENGDTYVGRLIAMAKEKISKEGRIIKDEIEITEGMRLDRGYIPPYIT